MIMSSNAVTALTKPLFPTLHRHLTRGASGGFLGRPLFPPLPDDLAPAVERTNRRQRRIPVIESLGRRKLIRSNSSPAIGALSVQAADGADEVSFYTGEQFRQLNLNSVISEIAVDRAHQAPKDIDDRDR